MTNNNFTKEMSIKTEFSDLISQLESLVELSFLDVAGDDEAHTRTAQAFFGRLLIEKFYSLNIKISDLEKK